MILLPLWAALAGAGACVVLGACLVFSFHAGRCEDAQDLAYDKGWDQAMAAATAHQLADSGLLAAAGLVGADRNYRHQPRHALQPSQDVTGEPAAPAGPAPPQGQRVAWRVFSRRRGRVLVAGGRRVRA